MAKALRASRSDKQSYATARRRYSIFTHQCKSLDAIAKPRNFAHNAAPHRTAPHCALLGRVSPREYGSVVVVRTRYPDVELALNRTVKARKLHLLSGLFLPVENQVGY